VLTKNNEGGDRYPTADPLSEPIDMFMSPDTDEWSFGILYGTGTIR
jgi:hypothetical protein